ncbi:hypothetical protein B484DRAFT_430679 [Ochromonadaceae sp. CCMP2298]|nr:hypothetical protein B484DRAFT_430679 [Ochromonadaceae sp. CCMP2298]
MDEEDVENRVAVGATRETRETEAATETEEEAGADVVRVVQNQERQEGQKRVSVVDVLAWAPGQAPTLAPTLTPETPEQRDVERLKEALELANEEMQRMADEVLRAGAAEEAAVLAVAAWEREGVQMRGEIQRLQSQKRRSFHTDITVADVEVEVEVKVEAESFGASAFDEDVSPLSVAVASSHPYLQAVQLVLRHSPSSVSLPDADGSLPLMHACGANAEAGVVSHLYGLYPDALRLQDPDIASMTEGNGALPLHDAVQNVRNEVGVVRNEVGFAGEEDSVGMGDTPHNSLAIVEVLLGVNPLAARKRDDFGALPLHRAAKFASLGVVMAVHAAFPEVSGYRRGCGS